jgi:hydrogenase maturation factor
MCIARVGRIVSASGGRSVVRFFDGRTSEGVDTSLVDGTVGSYVEVFGSLAISKLDEAEARRRRSAWRELRKAVVELRA